MRVLMIAQSSYDNDPRIIRLSSALIEKNIDVELICLRYETQAKYEVLNGVHVHRIMKNFHQDSILSYFFFSIVFVFMVLFKSIVLSFKNKHDLVHVHNMPDYLVFSAAYYKMKGIPILLDIHDLTVELFREKWAERGFKFFRFILETVEQLSCRFANHIITVTKECVDKLISRGVKPEKISLIMNSPDENKFQFDDTRFSKVNSKGFKVLYHGTLAVRFGLQHVVEAMCYVKQSYPQIEFHLFGNVGDQYSEQLKDQANKLDVSDKIEFHSTIPHSQINDLIKLYDIGIVPYEQTEYMNLAFPTKAGEYALTGLPFIMSDLKSVRSIFGDDSVLYINIHSNDTKLIAEAIIKLYDDMNLRRRISQNAYKDIQKISWSLMKKRYIKLVNTLNNSEQSANLDKHSKTHLE